MTDTTSFTEPFETFVAPARRKPAIWRILAGFAIIMAIYLAVTVGILSGLAGIVGVTEAGPRLSLAFLLLTFGGVTLGIWAAIKLLHARNFASLIGPLRPALRDFTVAAVVLLLVQAVLLAAWSVPYDGIVQRAFAAVAVTLPLVFVLTLIQTSAEEFLFRGYLMQQLAARFRSPWVWMLIPQALFAVGHYDPGNMGTLAWPVVAIIFVYALMWADLTRLTGNIGAACGWHFANNFLLFAFISPQDELAAFAWLQTPYATADTPMFAIVLDIIAAIAVWQILRRLLRR